jgi:hypothetical protein
MRAKHLHDGAGQPVSVADISRSRDDHTIQTSRLHGRSFHRPFDDLLGCDRKLFAIDCQFAKHPDVATLRRRGAIPRTACRCWLDAKLQRDTRRAR